MSCPAQCPELSLPALSELDRAAVCKGLMEILVGKPGSMLNSRDRNAKQKDISQNCRDNPHKQKC